ncbi:transporter substrate-binding domain-containing protein [Pigmentibacter sp. JX0631]|uniref:transporter substrate-binding domain-containing protein n=1 Tax=Pigmentibacter sp. JX0631 TaxID=2976982 RepID=UPI0024694D43|nr:transporter substrate-binding domain-containing protein [Pigmentibacter sp. JX0631]WGL59205.1 transporter substrate-binding domain-containing protein [Pigmentibacter sp. JX0631]
MKFLIYLAFKLWLFSLLIFSFLIKKAYSSEPTVKLATSTWSPYTLEELPDSGLLGALIKEAYKKEKIKIEIIFLPSARAPIETKKEVYLGYFPTYDCELNDFQKSFPLGKSTMGFAKLAKNKWNWSKLADLSGKTIGNVRDRFFSKEFNSLIESKTISLEESNNDTTNLTKLLHARIDLAVIEKNIFEYLISINPEFKNQFVFETKNSINRNLYICFNKSNDGKKYLNIFNSGLAKIDKDNFIFQYIMLNY